MRKGPKETFSKGDIQVFEKTININNYYGSSNQSLLVGWLLPKKTRDKFWQGCREKGPLHELLQPSWKTVQTFHKKLKIDILYDSAIPLLAPKELKLVY